MFLTRVFVPFALGYFLSQLLRSVNAVVFADLVAELSLDAWSVGFLTSIYFLAFASAQLPIGVALDRYGPRRTESALLLVAGVGAAVFGAASTEAGLTLGRAAIGLGVSSCLMASFHAFILFGSPSRLPLWNGSVMAVGALGALAGTIPVEAASAAYGWRSVFFALAVLSWVIAAIVFRAVPDPERHGDARLSEVARGLLDVFRSKVFWSVAPFSVAHQSAYLSIQSLWAGPWLRDVAGLDRAGVASTLALLAAAMGVGFFTLGFIAERLGRVGVSAVWVWVGSASVFQLVQLVITMQWAELAKPLWIGFGIFGAAGMLSYGVVSRRFPRELAGRVNTALNVLVFTGAFALQASIGAILNAAGSSPDAFAVAGYRDAFGLALALQVAGLTWLLVTSRWRAESEPA